MRRRFLKFSTCLFLPVNIAIAADTRPVATTLIENVTVVSAHLEHARQNRDVLILDGKVLDVIEAGSNYPTENRINGQGKFLIPGLIDSHVHLGHNPLVNRNDRDDFETLNRLYRRQLPRSFLYHGFTSVVDLDYSSSRGNWLPDTGIAPEIFHCGRGVRTAGGYGPSFVPPRFVHKAFPNLLYEPRHAAQWPEELDPELYSVEAAVRRVTQSGAICLKTYVESGFGGVFDWPIPGPETLAALSEAAHEQGLVFVVHANSAEDWQRAIAGGADVIAHGLWHWGGNLESADLTEEPLQAIENAVRGKVALQPTLRVVEGEKATLNWGLIEDPRMENVLTPGLLRYLRSQKGRWSQKAMLDLYAEHSPAPDVAPATLIGIPVRRAKSSLLRFHRSGGTIVLGSDTPGQDGIGNPPGLNGYLEMVGWAQAGIPLETIFRSATFDNARVFGLDRNLGTVETGKQADLLLLNANPLVDVEAYDDISVVIVDGHPIAREDLSALVLDVKTTP